MPLTAGVVYVVECDGANITDSAGGGSKCATAASTAWVAKDSYITANAPVAEPILPPLTLAEGTAVGLSIAGCWAVGLCFRLYVRAGQSGRYG
jgi:hypothetical protein